MLVRDGFERLRMRYGAAAILQMLTQALCERLCLRHRRQFGLHACSPLTAGKSPHPSLFPRAVR